MINCVRQISSGSSKDLLHLAFGKMQPSLKCPDRGLRLKAVDKHACVKALGVSFQNCIFDANQRKSSTDSGDANVEVTVALVLPMLELMRTAHYGSLSIWH